MGKRRPLSFEHRCARAVACQLVLIFLVFALGVALPALPAVARSSSAIDLIDMSLEELGNIQVTSVSKRPESLADAAASLFIITAEDIRRSGFRTLPDVLRLAPNLQVAQDTAWGYYISARGLNSFSPMGPNKILALIDGRPVYSPLYSGVLWEMQDVMLEDVERIEVISGPAGTLWGINAVNGVINIITRPAGQTQGALVALEHGNRGSNTAFRYGGTLGAGGNFRVYGKYLDRKPFSGEDGNRINDAWRTSQAGFRADWNSPWQSVSVQGNAYSGSAAQPAPGVITSPRFKFVLDDITYSGLNLSRRWDRYLDDGSSLSLKANYDQNKRDTPPFFAQSLDLINVDFQHTLHPQGRHAAVWGVNFRYSWDRMTNSPAIAFLPPDLNQKWASLFAQDEISLSDELRLTLGARMEHHPYVGNEFLPNARLAWKPASDHLLWGAISRAVRGPTRFDHDVFFPGRETPGDPPFRDHGRPQCPFRGRRGIRNRLPRPAYTPALLLGDRLPYHLRPFAYPEGGP